MGQRLVTLRQAQGHHTGAVGKAFKVALTIKGFQRVAGIKLPCAEKGLEVKTAVLRIGKQLKNKLAIVARQNHGIVIAFGDQPRQLVVQTGEGHGIRLNVVGHKRRHCLAIFVKRDATIAVVEIQHRVEGMEIRRLSGYTFCGCRCQNSLTPLRTLSTSCGVPISSKR